MTSPPGFSRKPGRGGASGFEGKLSKKAQAQAMAAAAA